MQKGYNIYNQNNAMVESPEKLTQMLYEGILKFSSLVKRSLKDNDMEKKAYYINRTTAIYLELISTLDVKKGGEVAHYLYGLYNHQLKLLIDVNIKNDLQKLDEVIKVASVLLEAWKEETAVECAVA
jgi:flagellar protein FliS